MESILAWLSANYVNIAAIYGGVVAIATVVVKLTPTQADDAILGKIVGIVDWFAAHKKPVADASTAPTEKIEVK